MSTKRFGSAIPRLQQDYLSIHKDPVPYIRAEPLPADMLEWHYVIMGPENTPYAGGYYHGTLIFTQQYPFKPPAIYMRTPNGRFETNRRLCLSITDYHPDEWNPAWCVSSILTGFLSFMLENNSALGTVKTLTNEKLDLARKSLAFNLKDETFCQLFPDICKEIKEKLAQNLDLPERVCTDVKPMSSDNDNSFVFIISVCIIGLVAYHFFGYLLVD